MPFVSKLRSLSAAVLLLSATAGCPAVTEGPQRCNADLDCDTTARCIEGVCEDTGVSEPSAPNPDVIEPESPEPSAPAPDTPEPAVEPDGEPAPLDGGVDAGAPSDSGPLVDAGGAGDAGTAFDAGAPDGGQSDAGPNDGGVNQTPTDAFETPWHAPNFDKRARFRLANGRYPDLDAFPLVIELSPAQFSTDELSLDSSAYQAWSETGERLPIHFERLRNDTAIAWVSLDVERYRNRQAFFVYFRSAQGTGEAPFGPLYGSNVVAAYHLDESNGVLRDHANGNAGETTATPVVGGVIGDARELGDGALDFPNLVFPLGIDGSARTGSFSFWIRVTAFPSEPVLLFGNEATAAAEGGYFSLFLTSNGIDVVAVDAEGDQGTSSLSLSTNWTRLQVSWRDETLRIGDGVFSASTEILPPQWNGPTGQQFRFHEIGGVRIDEFQVHRRYLDRNWASPARLAGRRTYALYEAEPMTPLEPEPTNASTSPPEEPILRYTFDEGEGDTIHDTSGVTPPVDLENVNGTYHWEDGRLILDAASYFEAPLGVDRIRDAIITSGAISVEVWARPEHPYMDGPARLFTYALDSSVRNFTLGQDEESWVLRLRTTTTNTNGSSNTGRGKPIGEDDVPLRWPQLEHIVFTRNIDGTALVYRNGELVSEIQWPGTFDNWAPGYELGLGNEPAGSQRAWTGELSTLSVYDRPLDENEIVSSYENGPL